jgi:peptidoglycan/LPS O-acetylase OafA/YrhL
MTTVASAYVHAIDGLRALAVLSVLAFHLNPALLPGGFVGVDIFFAISGYVVCTAALNKPAGSFWAFCWAFYARRVRRILPALLVVLLVTALLSALFVPEAWLSQANKRTGIAAFFGASNFVLGSFSGDYFSPRAEYNPFTHTWSLAIEEQFYLLFAPLMFMAGMLASPRWRRLGIALLVVLCGASLALCVVWSERSPVWAFYGSPARFWEILLGVLACLALPRLAPVLARWPRPVAQALGAVLLVSLGVVLLLADSRQFPWPWALWPVVATVGLMLLLTVRTDLWVSGWLSSAAARWVGQRAYSLYLWHWPVYVLMRWTCGLETPLQQLAAVTASVALAMASHRWVEEPVRHGRWLRGWPDRRMVLGGALATVCVAGLSAVLFKGQGHVSLSVTRDKAAWFPDTVPRVADDARRCELSRKSLPLADGEMELLEPVACKRSPQSRQIFVLGDSHAGAYFAMLAELVQTTGHPVQVLRMSGCPVFNLKEPNATHEAACASFARAAVAHVKASARPGDVLFLPSLRLHRLVDQWTIPEGPLQEAMQAEPTTDRGPAVSEAVAQLAPLTGRGVQIIVEAPKPLAVSPAFRCTDWFNRGNPVCRWGDDVPRASVERYRSEALAAVNAVVSALPGARVWDPLPQLCSGQTCGAFKDGKPVIFDGDHLTGHANHMLLDPFMRQVAVGAED